MKKYLDNPSLPYLDLPFDWQGTPIDKNGRFVNHEYVHNLGFRKVLKWQLSRNPQKLEKKNDSWRLAIDNTSDFMNSKNDCIVWLGHASFFIRIDGITLLIDPVLFDVSVIRRQSILPVNPALLSDLDYILISHDHRDHCDVKSLRLLAGNNKDTTYLTGLNLDKTLNKIIGSNLIQSAGWYQQYITQENIKVYYVPTRHWGRRFLHDTNCNLWGGYIIQAAGKTIYFSGDSGYGSHFDDISKIFPNIDYCMVGIGAYKPDYIMSSSHLSPNEAILAFQDSGAKFMIPMHYGTFDLSDEPIGDPLRTLRKLEKEEKNMNGKIEYLIPGEEVIL